MSSSEPAQENAKYRYHLLTIVEGSFIFWLGFYIQESAMTEVVRLGQKVAKRLYAPRVIGLSLVFLCLVPLIDYSANSAQLYFIVLFCLVWPHIAYWRSKRAIATRTESQNSMVDALGCGACIAFSHYSLIPSAAIFSLVAMNSTSVGGWKLLLKCITAFIVALFITGNSLQFLSGQSTWLLSPPFTMNTDTSTLLLAAPIFIIYPTALAWFTFKISLRLEKQNIQLLELSRTDGLSGLHTRTYWEEQVRTEFDRFERTQQTSCLVMLDIDHFKSINDKYGHLVGDDFIRHVSAVLSENLRLIDIIGRYGGEEFGVILPNTALPKARIIAERLRFALAESRADGYEEIKCTVSVGIAELTPQIGSYLDWLKRADHALFHAKRSGRNCTKIWTSNAEKEPQVEINNSSI